MKPLRSKLYSFLLLAVFLPAWLLATLHTHPQTEANEVECAQCLHHLPHAGHLVAGNGEMGECVLCHFLSLPAMAAPLVVLLGFVPCSRSVRAFLQQRAASAYINLSKSRAPPVLSIAF